MLKVVSKLVVGIVVAYNIVPMCLLTLTFSHHSKSNKKFWSAFNEIYKSKNKNYKICN